MSSASRPTLRSRRVGAGLDLWIALGSVGRTTGVPFVAGGGRGGGSGDGFGGFGAAAGSLLEPGVYMVKVTIGDKVLQTSVNVLDDIWMHP